MIGESGPEWKVRRSFLRLVRISVGLWFAKPVEPVVAGNRICDGPISSDQYRRVRYIQPCGRIQLRRRLQRESTAVGGPEEDQLISDGLGIQKGQRQWSQIQLVYCSQVQMATTTRC